MKKSLKLGGAFLAFALFASTLNAGINIKKTWTPQSSTMVPGERVTFTQYLVTTDEADSIEKMLVEVRGAPAARNAFKRIVVENGFGRIVGSGNPPVDSPLVWVNFEQMVVLPEQPVYLAPKADVNVGPIVTPLLNKGVTLIVRELHLSGGRGFSLTETEGTGATHQVALGDGMESLNFVRKLEYVPSVSTGPRQFLGGFMIGTDTASDFTTLPNIRIHLSAGLLSDIKNLQVLMLTQGGNWHLTTLHQHPEYGSEQGDYYLAEFVPLQSGVSYIAVFGDLGVSFSSGNSTIAVSTNPGKWKSTWGKRSGKELALPDGIAVGPTVKVVPKREEKG